MSKIKINLFVFLIFILFKLNNSDYIAWNSAGCNDQHKCCNGLNCKYTPRYNDYACYKGDCRRETRACEMKVDECCYGLKCLSNNDNCPTCMYGTCQKCSKKGEKCGSTKLGCCGKCRRDGYCY
ncbi:hypothetical protein ACQ4LE_010474 [Meloidogyne hapla]